MPSRLSPARFFLSLLCCLPIVLPIDVSAAESLAPEAESSHVWAAGEAEFEAIRIEFFSEEPSVRDNDVPWFQNMETVVFEKDDVPYALKSFPDTRMFRRACGFFACREGVERFLGAPAQAYDPRLVPWPEVVVADINDDGIPDFFILDQPGHTHSSYRFADPADSDPIATPLFIPFAGQNPLPSPDPFPDYIFSENGAGGIPAFLLPDLAVEFHQRRGPHYDTERWCFAGIRFYLCEKRRQTYYPASDNNDLIFLRVMRFDHQGNVRSAFCRTLDGGDTDAPRLMIMAELPLFSVPAETVSDRRLPQGTMVRILDYQLVEGSEDMRLWYRVQDEGDPTRAGWCCVTVDTPVIKDDRLIFSKVHNKKIREYLEHPYSVLSLERMEQGAKALVRKEDGGTLLIENIPAAFPYGME